MERQVEKKKLHIYLYYLEKVRSESHRDDGTKTGRKKKLTSEYHCQLAGEEIRFVNKQ